MKKFELLYASYSEADFDLFVDSLGIFDTQEEAEEAQRRSEAEDAEDDGDSITRTYKIKEIVLNPRLSVSELSLICDTACSRFNLSGACNLSSEDASDDSRCYTFVSGLERKSDEERLKALTECARYLEKKDVTVGGITKYGAHSFQFNVYWKYNCKD